MPCMLSRLPWEILLHTFDYFNVVDLLHTFDQVDAQLDSILRSYSRAQLNFKSAKKSTFYFVCERIIPEQIGSLVLSDDLHSPHQIKLFMSLIPLIICVNLRSISLHDIADANMLCLMMSHLEDTQRLYSISVDGHSLHLNKNICRSIAASWISLLNLKRLTFFSSAPLIALQEPLSRLTHLTLTSCVASDLPTAIRSLPNLSHFHVRIPVDHRLPSFDCIPPRLVSMRIECKSWMLFREVENLFSHAASLRRFILETSGEAELLHGQRWQSLIKSKLPNLTELALDISPEQNDITGDAVLASFQTPFWTSQKRWQMACMISTDTNSCVRLFSVPHFAPTNQWYPQSEGFVYHALSPYPFHEHCKELQIYQYLSPVTIPSPFRQIEILTLYDPTPSVDSLRDIMDLSTVRHLKVEASVPCPVFDELLRAAPNIDQLSMKQRALRRMLEFLCNENIVCEQIKQLHIKEVLSSTDMEQISRVFPNLERINLLVKGQADIHSIFDGLPQLISSSIHWSHPNPTSARIVEQYLQGHICTDGTYYVHAGLLYLWHN